MVYGSPCTWQGIISATLELRKLMKREGSHWDFRLAVRGSVTPEAGSIKGANVRTAGAQLVSVC